MVSDTRGRPGELVTISGLLGVVAALIVTVLVDFRTGGYVVAVVLAAMGAARLSLPVRLLGAAAVRSRSVDAMTYLGLAAAVAVFARIVPGN